MSVTIVISMGLREGTLPDAIRWLEDNLADTRAFEGCEGVTSYTHADDPNRITLIETWGSADQHAAYSQWRADNAATQGSLRDHVDGVPTRWTLSAVPNA